MSPVAKKESIELSATGGFMAIIKKLAPYLFAGFVGVGSVVSSGNSSIPKDYQDSLNSCKTITYNLDKELSNQIIKTENLEAKFVELNTDIKELRRETREILVILTKPK